MLFAEEGILRWKAHLGEQGACVLQGAEDTRRCQVHQECAGGPLWLCPALAKPAGDGCLCMTPNVMLAFLLEVTHGIRMHDQTIVYDLNGRTVRFVVGCSAALHGQPAAQVSQQVHSKEAPQGVAGTIRGLNSCAPHTGFAIPPLILQPG